MALSGAVIQSRSPTSTLGDETVAVLRIRIDELERLVEEHFESQEQFIRAADISRSAWVALRDPSKKRADLAVLAKVLKALDATISDILVYDPDEKIG